MCTPDNPDAELSFWELADAYLAGELGLDAMQNFETRLETCPECRNKMAFKLKLVRTPRSVWEAAMIGIAERSDADNGQPQLIMCD